ncbi:MAG: mechanosensitive ion channel, partial [Candidatus Marinimicrobia bacterium]|nr:mechanosensitive ion channel [Candidatus Neomarinimicrobiota bacterium]
DFVSGLFILIENQYGVGDRVKIGNFKGDVIKITMRSTVLMDDKNNMYYISNGLIKDVTNMSQQNKS